LIKIPVRPPLAVREQLADLDAQNLGDPLDVVEVEGDLTADSPRDVHRRSIDACGDVGAGHHLARQQRADLFSYLLAKQSLIRTPICHT
jgi:hypothetical protein